MVQTMLNVREESFVLQVRMNLKIVLMDFIKTQKGHPLVRNVLLVIIALERDSTALLVHVMQDMFAILEQIHRLQLME